MMTLKFTIIAFFLLFMGKVVTAQTVFVNSTNLISNTNELLNINDKDWSFYADQENNLFYIDFENININISEVVLKDQDNETVFKENVLDLPVNTIYELDLSTFQKGQYFLELRSYTKTIGKNLDVK